MSFSPLTTTATDLQHLLTTHSLTSVQLIQHYLAQIDLHNPRLRALISVAPEDLLLAVAAALDEERLQGRVRGPLHGIPIVLKDSFMTASEEMGMGTTAGAGALVGARVKENGAIVQRLIEGGGIILGKGNMTVRFSFFESWTVVSKGSNVVS